MAFFDDRCNSWIVLNSIIFSEYPTTAFAQCAVTEDNCENPIISTASIFILYHLHSEEVDSCLGLRLILEFYVLQSDAPKGMSYANIFPGISDLL